jgi:hypothetical protein
MFEGIWTALKSYLATVNFLKMIVEWLVAAQNKQIGRNEVAYDVTRETAEAENRMRDVPRPSDDDVARSLQDGRF